MEIIKISNIRMSEMLDTVERDDLEYMIGRTHKDSSINNWWKVIPKQPIEDSGEPMAVLNFQLVCFIMKAAQLLDIDQTIYYKEKIESQDDKGLMWAKFYVKRIYPSKGTLGELVLVNNKLNDIEDYLIPINTWIYELLLNCVINEDADLHVRDELMDYILGELIPHIPMERLKDLDNCGDIWAAFLKLTGARIATSETHTSAENYLESLIQEVKRNPASVISEFIRRIEAMQ